MIVVDSSGTGDPNSKRIGLPGRVSLKLSVSPDFSSTEFFQQDKPGINYGITAGYRITRRWSVYTGVIMATKIYSSTSVSESYNTPGGYNYPISQLDGNCKMLDIPVNVYYSFNPNKSLSFKAGLGFSSYIILQEDYTYYLDKPYGKNSYSQRIENENNEWFKMMNVSVIMQKKIHSRLFLEVEPFVKLPLAGIGEGEIPLYSIGSFISLRYDF